MLYRLVPDTSVKTTHTIRRRNLKKHLKQEENQTTQDGHCLTLAYRRRVSQFTDNYHVKKINYSNAVTSRFKTFMRVRGLDELLIYYEQDTIKIFVWRFVG